MDRFIEDLQSLRKTIVPVLKSNMDRFIDSNKSRCNLAKHI